MRVFFASNKVIFAVLWTVPGTVDISSLCGEAQRRSCGWDLVAGHDGNRLEEYVRLCYLQLLP